MTSNPLFQLGVMTLLKKTGSQGFPGDSASKESACSVRDLGSYPGLGRSPGESHGSPFQYFCLENNMDRRICQIMVHRIAKNQTWLKQLGAKETGKLPLNPPHTISGNPGLAGITSSPDPHWQSHRFILFCLLVCSVWCAKSFQLRPTFCNPMDGSPPGSSVVRII